MSLFSQALTERLESIAALTTEEVSRLEAHYNLLQRWNRRLNLTSIHRLDEIVERHYCESIVLAKEVCQSSVSIADIGSGAGFPGFPIGILKRDSSITLVESHARKCVFLRESTRGISNFRVAEVRAEDLDGVFDWVVSRAVRWDAVVPVARALAASVGLLIGGFDLSAVMREPGFEWLDPLALPWGDRRFVLIGQFVRAG